MPIDTPDKTYELMVVQANGSQVHKNVADFTTDHLGGLVVYGPSQRRIAAYAPGGWLYARELPAAGQPTNSVQQPTHDFAGRPMDQFPYTARYPKKA